MNTLKTMRNALLVAMMFAGAGWYGGYRQEHANGEHVWGLALRGFCAATDIDGNRHWYSCQDAAVAIDQMQRDAETSAILSDMASKSTKKAAVRK